MLPVHEVTGRIVSHALACGAWRRSHVCRGELLADITNARAEVRSAFGEVFIIREQMPVRRQHRAASAGIGDDGRIRFESRDVLSRKLARAFKVSGVRVQCTAADLTCRHLDVKIIRTEHTLRRAIHTRKQSLTNTSFEQQYFFVRFLIVAPLRLYAEDSSRTVKQRNCKLSPP